MAKLYRSEKDPQHWTVWSPDLGWARFPAKAGGWREHRAIAPEVKKDLLAVPLWLAFNTGLIESLQRRGLDRAA
jgi:hypothetical protein